MWGPSIIGFGSYHYKYESGREGDAPAAAFSPRKANLVIYLDDPISRYETLLESLGPHTTSKVCLYIKRLSAVDLDVLREIIAESYRNVSTQADICTAPSELPARSDRQLASEIAAEQDRPARFARCRRQVEPRKRHCRDIDPQPVPGWTTCPTWPRSTVKQVRLARESAACRAIAIGQIAARSTVVDIDQGDMHVANLAIRSRPDLRRHRTQRVLRLARRLGREAHHVGSFRARVLPARSDRQQIKRAAEPPTRGRGRDPRDRRRKPTSPDRHRIAQ